MTRIVTPGTATGCASASFARKQLSGAVARNGARAGVAYVDVSTGEFRATEIAADELSGLLESIGAREVLVAAENVLFPLAERKSRVATELEDWVFSADYADRILREHFRLHSLDGCGLAGRVAAIGPKKPFFTICETRSGLRSITWIPALFRSARRTWCWIPSPSAIWNYWSLFFLRAGRTTALR